MKVLLKRYVMIAALWSTTLTATANDNGTSLVAFAGQASSDSVCDATEQAGLSGCDDSGSIYGLGISHRMQNLGFDASVLRMSAFDAGSDSNPLAGSVDFSAWMVGVTGFLNAGRKPWDVYARGGMALWKADLGGNGLTGTSQDTDGASPYLGAGGEIVSGRVSFFGEVSRIADVELVDGSKDDLSQVTLGIKARIF